MQIKRDFVHLPANLRAIVIFSPFVRHQLPNSVVQRQLQIPSRHGRLGQTNRPCIPMSIRRNVLSTGHLTQAVPKDRPGPFAFVQRAVGSSINASRSPR